MDNSANPTLGLNPGPIPGLPADHTPLRLMVPRVLVVEDEMTVALLIEDMVTELAYEVAAVVPRLDDAMRLLDSDSFDLAMLDVHLNGKTVFPFAAELEDRDIPFLFATAYGVRAAMLWSGLAGLGAIVIGLRLRLVKRPLQNLRNVRFYRGWRFRFCEVH